MSQWWDNRTPIFAVVHIIPIDTMEERVGFDTFGAASHVSKTVGAVDCAKLADYVFGICRNLGLLRKLDGFGNNPVVVSK